MTTASSQNPQTEPSPKDPNAPATTGPNRKRRPRKLNKDRPADGAAGSGPSNAANNEGEGAVNHELEALKSRVRGLEAKVEELYKTSPGRSPRRRGKGRKGSNQAQPADPTPANAADTAAAEAANEAELQRLEGELASARQDLATASRPSRQRPARTASGGDDVEEVPRLNGPAVEGDKDGKAVTLSGSYRIPLPASVSMSDVRNIQSGIASAHAVARGFLDARRADAPRSPPRRNSAGGEGGQGQSWSEWFGAYSMSISRAVKNIEADAALETAGQRSVAKRPVVGPRRASAPGAGAKAGGSGVSAQKKAAGPGAGVRPGGTGKAASTATRPPLNPRTSNATPTRGKC